MNTYLRSLGALAAFVAMSFPPASEQQHPPMPPGMSHEEHLTQMQRDADMKTRGAVAMGFDQDRVAHHFELTTRGGAIRVEVKDASDESNRQAVRTHLRGIAAAFADGRFDAPLVTHGEVPPGVADLKRLKASITCSYGDTPNGGIVRIATTNVEAADAIHEFLRYQITEHRTGDPLTIDDRGLADEVTRNPRQKGRGVE
jgi:hypothetical protein